MKNFLLIILSFSIFSCGSKQRDNINSDPFSNSTFLNDEKAEVRVMPLHYSIFNKEIISNGKLSAFQKADLKFRSVENLVSVSVKNGDRVSNGQIIAQLDNFSLVAALKQSRDQFEKAEIELQDILIGQGYTLKDSDRIPRETMRIARVKSDYDKTMHDLELAEYNLKNSSLRAPFAGVVANLFSKENNQLNNTNKFCTIIDDSKFEAEFTILENELGSVKTGQGVKIIPFAYPDLSVTAIINKINPVVDDNGLVKITALCNNSNLRLTEGMNVKILVQNQVPQQLVIPKQALVLRGEKQVIFTLSEGRAKWNYVKTDLENSTSFTITEGLKEGDTVIYEGNLNLAHDAEVKVLKNEKK